LYRPLVGGDVRGERQGTEGRDELDEPPGGMEIEQDRRSVLPLFHHR